MKHKLKTDPAVFAAVLCGAKTHEIRFNDRNFQIGDELLLQETSVAGEMVKRGSPLDYTGREITTTVTHVLEGYGLLPEWVILSIAPPESENTMRIKTKLRAKDLTIHVWMNMKKSQGLTWTQALEGMVITLSNDKAYFSKAQSTE